MKNRQAASFMMQRRVWITAHSSALGTVCFPGVRACIVATSPHSLSNTTAAAATLLHMSISGGPPDPSVPTTPVLLSSSEKFPVCTASHLTSSFHPACSPMRHAGRIALYHLHECWVHSDASRCKWFVFLTYLQSMVLLAGHV